MDHDQLFKTVLQTYFQDFLQLFYPEVAGQVDFQSVHFLDKELFTNLPEGRRREPDIVAQIKTHDGSPEIVLVHVEVQLRRERDFEERMFQYYAMLWLRYRIPILPIVIYLRGGREGLVEEEYRVRLFGRERLRFRYESIRLAPLDAGEYLGKGNPLGAALAALMDRRKVGEPVGLRALMMQRVAESDRDDARKFLLLNLIETYFKLTAVQKESFSRLLSKKEFREAREMEVTWADEIREEGRKEGLEKGRHAGLVAGKRDTLLQQLATKFGSLPEETTFRVQAMESLDELDRYLGRVLSANSLDEMGLGNSAG